MTLITAAYRIIVSLQAANDNNNVLFLYKTALYRLWINWVKNHSHFFLGISEVKLVIC